MEEKLKRECKGYVEKTFKKYDKFGSASIPKEDVPKLLKIIIPEYDTSKYEEELNELLANYLKASKYTVHNRQTNQFEVKYLENTVDFPSALAITIHFLKKIEKDGNTFSGQSVVKVKDFPGGGLKSTGRGNDHVKKKMF